MFNFLKINKESKKNSGSTFILVIAILSLLILVAITLALTSKVEINSASNYSEGVQSRLSVYTGIRASAKQFEKAQRNTSLNTSNTDINIIDEAGKININTADKTLLTILFSKILISQNINFGSPGKMAEEIVRHRYGPDGKPGVAGKDDNGNSNFSDITKDGIDNDKDGVIDNPEEKLLSVNFDGIDNNHDGTTDKNTDGFESDGIDNDGDGIIDEKDEGIDDEGEFIPDPRIPPNGDDTPFFSVNELKSLPSFKNDIIFNAVSPYLTTLSVDFPATLMNDKLIPKIAINTLNTGQLYQRLLDEIRPTSDTETLTLLKQFVVNIIDYRDRDNIPTVFPNSSSKYPLLGLEKTPYIYEILADSVTETKKWKDKKGKTREENDDGEYIALYNPYSSEININNWKLYITKNTKGNKFEKEDVIPLEGKIASNGFLIITDDYNEDNDPSPEDYADKYGSFLGIFGKVKNQTNHKIQEYRALDIPDEEGIVYLIDNKGNIIDYFKYEGTRFNGVMKSYVRLDPSQRIYKTRTPKPFELYNEGLTKNQIELMEELKTADRDHRFVTESDILKVSCSFTLPGKNEGKIFQYPSLSNKGNKGLNLSLIEKITVLDIGEEAIKLSAADTNAMDVNKVKSLVDKIQMPKIYGKVNLNSTSPLLLEVLFADLPTAKTDPYGTVSDRNINIKKTLINPKGPKPIDNLPTNPTVVYFDKISDIFSSDESTNELNNEQLISMANKAFSRLTTSTYSFTMSAKNNPAAYKASKNPNRIIFYSLIGIDNFSRTPQIVNMSFQH